MLIERGNSLEQGVSTDLVTFESHDAVGIVTLDRPDKLNAIRTDMMWRLGDHVRQAARDDAIRVLVVTGAGEHFSAGGDMAEMLKFSPLSSDEALVAWQQNLELIERSPKPVIAAVRGFAFGGGTELAIACHIRVAGQSARFGQTEIALDHLPGGGGTQRLPRLIPLGRAYEHLLTGEPITAQEALDLGLVNHVWPDAELFDRTLELAGRIAARAPTAVRYTMEAIRGGLMAPLEVGMRLERAFASLTGDSDEARIGLEQFQAKTRKAIDPEDL